MHRRSVSSRLPDVADDDVLTARLRAAEGKWWHSIDLGRFGATKGFKSPKTLETEWFAMRVPPLSGKSVLDIGAWDGYFSFRAEREGAARVTALDHFAWSVDPFEKLAYEERCRDEEVTPQPWDTVESLWKPDELPGKMQFDLAHEILESRVEAVVADFAGGPANELPEADVVFFLGVLYHLKDPVGAFERLRSVTRELAIVETEALALPGYPNLSLAEFSGADEMEGDPTNWWAPSQSALVAMAKAAGFERVDVLARPPRTFRHRAIRAVRALTDTSRRISPGLSAEPVPTPLRYRAILHAWA